MFYDLKNLTASELEEKVLQFWEENQIFQKSILRRKGKKSFSFYDGPPFANGLPHYGHLLASTIKDTVTRFWTMRGYRVERRVGWDTHGLPVEYEVEKELGLKSKRDILKLGIEKFNEHARKSVFRYTKEWESTLRRIGRWADYKNAYATLDNDYVESVWWVFKKLWEKNLVYKDYRVSPYCPRCGTPLSNFEVGLGYKDVEENSVYVKFRLKTNPSALLRANDLRLTTKNKKSISGQLPAASYLLAWTTTPWTLPGNVGLAVHPGATYVAIKKNDETLILGEERLLLIEKPYVVVCKIKGRNLVGLRYEPLFDSLAKQKIPNIENAFQVVPADFVSMDDGTGIVHTAVMYGQEDFELGKKYKLPMKHTVDDSGRFTEDVAEWAGQFVKDAEPAIIKNLEERNLLYRKEPTLHSYPFCWRCETPLIYYALGSWYVKVTAFRKQLLENNKAIHWVPEHIKHGRFGNGLKDAPDWAISRNRFWGAPMPVFSCLDCKEYVIAGSLNDLVTLAPHSGNRYFALRHGRADSNVFNIADARPEPFHISLTKQGREKIKKLIPPLKRLKIDLVFASPLRRTQETAKEISEGLGIPLHTDKRLEEYNVGIWNGKPVEDFFKAVKNSDRWNEAPDGGETLGDVRRRVMDFIQDIDKKYADKKILIVSHGDPLWILEGAAQGLSNTKINASGEKHYLKQGELREIKLLRLPYTKDGVVDLHRPHIDTIALQCPSCKKELHRSPEVFDCWFESGSMPYAQWHYPFENKKVVESTFPADFIAEGLDQTRCWFYSLHVLAGALTLRNVGLGKNKPAFKNVIVNGLVLSEAGQKLSKRLRNYTDPGLVFQKYGADSLRFFLLSSTPIGEDYRFSDKGVQETKTKTIDRLLNCYNFLALYAHQPRHENSSRADTRIGINLRKINQRQSASILDRWITARLHETINRMTQAMTNYELTDGSRALIEFFDDLSNWYIRRSRRRLQKPNDQKDFTAAVSTLESMIRESAKLMAPIAPFTADAIYKALGDLRGRKSLESVHLEDWPRHDARFINKNLMILMDEVRRLASIALAKRAEAGIRVRQPLRELRITNYELGRNKDLLAILKDEVNVKEIIVDKNSKDEVFLDIRITPALREEGLLRELIRLVQGLRQDGELEPRDIIALFIEGDADAERIAERHMDMLKREVGAKTIAFSPTSKFDAELDTKLGDHRIWIGMKKI
ncbi:class I tRNA ligase family protein [Candidatus Wolfebacteria bacterium]|nr:class I tRNA ligase family protein [Candidatus Wolfebacteria bacterium]